MEFKNINNLINQRKFNEAKEIIIKFLEKNEKLNPEELKTSKGYYVNIYFTLSQICNQLNELVDSKNYILKHLQINTEDLEGILLLANLQLKTRDIKKAEKNYKKILKINDKYLPAIVNLAILYEGIGKIDEAKKYYTLANKIDPNNLKFYFNQIRLNSNYLDEKKFNFIKDVIDKNNISEKDQFLKNFILSKNFEKKKDYLNEIKYLNYAHQDFLKFNINKKSYEYWLKIIPSYFNKFIYKRSYEKKLKKMCPIFIIGLPRSGSTVTELIISTSKTFKYTLGETSLINYSLINNYSDKLFDASKRDNLEIDIKFLEKKILTSFQNFKISDYNNCIFIDKSLENFFYIDLILEIFPKAKFILTERKIYDNIIGIYKKVLLDIPWAHTLSDIVKYIDNYKKITDFYKKKYNEKFFSIKLEDIQNLDEEKIKNLFKFCNLEFNEKYFEFQKNFQFVNNASNIQIRNKLKKDYYNDYRCYFNLLDEFKGKYNWLK